MRLNQLALRLARALTVPWIKNGDLGDVFAVHNAVFTYSPALITNTALMALVQRLLAAEVTVGGPYQMGGTVDIIANTHIAQFARLVAQPLPKVEAFLTDHPSPASQPAASAIAKEAAQLVQLVTEQQRELAAHQAQVLHVAHMALVQHAKEPLLTEVIQLAQRVSSSPSGQEIALLPYFFAQNNQKPGDSRWHTLGAANICGWAAYLIYDDAMDDKKSTAQLPAANIAMRTSQELFGSAIGTPDYVADAFAAMDNANAWELRHCRFAVQEGIITVGRLPQYGSGQMLAMRSWGHALGPLGMVQESQKIRATAGLTHFLIARQLQDDLYDWEQDVRHGHISYVVATLLRELGAKTGDYPIKKLVSEMTVRFKQAGAARICRIILRHTRAARRDLTDIIPESSGMYDILFKLEHAAKKVLNVPAADAPQK